MSVLALRPAPTPPGRAPALLAPETVPDVGSVTDRKLLFAIAGDATEALLQRFGTLAAALGADRYELGRIGGADLAWTFAVIQECAGRMGRASLTRRCLMSSYAPVLAYLTMTMAWRGREQFRVLFLDKKNQLIVDGSASRFVTRTALSRTDHEQTECSLYRHPEAARNGTVAEGFG